MKNLIKYIIICFICYFCLSENLIAQSLKDSVCIVYPEYSEKEVDFFKQFSYVLKAEGYVELGNISENLKDKTFGSGFVYKNTDGQTFIITNRHVVNNALTAKICFDLEDSKSQTYENLPVFYYDNEIDVALIKLPENVNKIPLKFSVKSISDGDDVYTAGFPGLGKEAVWQFGKGIVSNSSAKIEDLTNPACPYVIQHTAEIDGGNSGGPLLIKEASSYSVIGINTWKAAFRQNTNFSIPSKFVNNSIKKAFDASLINVSPDQVFTDFGNEIWDEKKSLLDMTDYISNDFAFSSGGDAFVDVLRTSSINIRSSAITLFRYNPIEALKYSVLCQILKKLNSVDSKKQLVSYTKNIDADSYLVTYDFGAKENYSFLWKKEMGYWKIVSVSIISESKIVKTEADNPFSEEKKSSKKSKENVDPDIYDNSWFSLTVEPSFTLNKNFFTEANFKVRLSNMDIGILASSGKINYKSGGENYRKKAYTFGIDLRAKYPLAFENTDYIPFMDFKFGIINIDDEKNLFFDFSTGLEIGFAINSPVVPIIGFDVGYKKNQQFDFDDVLDNGLFSALKKNIFIGIYGGIKFGKK